MPQMAPMNWIMLFTFFSIMFLIINSMNYFSFSIMPKKLMNQKSKIKINWKW
uniref:ATP synthase complex subunit 8 n=1 Tax=Attagenus hottentotus TaxID=1205591 RepID=A0A0S2MRQ5_9COLE|nr:ATP synthase F0 subunit 8 [Attagenus hottentotus]